MEPFSLPSKNILLFARDPGGANTIIPLIEPLKAAGLTPRLVGKEIALKKYTEAGYQGEDINQILLSSGITPQTLNQWLQEIVPGFILTGTSGEDPTEKYLWQAAQSLGIPSAAILDQWLNYGIRFSNYGVSECHLYEKDRQHPYVPDQILVMDEEAKNRLIAEGLEADRIQITGQPYFQWFQQQWEQFNTLKEASARVRDSKQSLNLTPNSQVITFVSEPLSQLKTDSKGAVDFGYTEKTVLNQLLNALDTVSETINLDLITLLIKLHPREDSTNYKTFFQNRKRKSQVSAIIDQSLATLDVLAVSDVVCGMTSMMLLEAFLVGKPVLNIQIGLNQPNPFVLAQRNWVQTLDSPETLTRQLAETLTTLKTGGVLVQEPESVFPFQPDAIQNVVSCVTQRLFPAPLSSQYQQGILP